MRGAKEIEISAESRRFFESIWPTFAPIVLSDARTKREVDAVCRMANLQPGERILDAGCGFGRHSIELARRGFRVHGVDRSCEAIEQARSEAQRQGVDCAFEVSDLRVLRAGGLHDAAISLFGSFGFDEDDDLIVSRIAGAVRPGGKVIIDTVNRDWMVANFTREQRTDAGPYEVHEQREFDFESSRVRLRVTMADLVRGTEKRGALSIRVYSCHELAVLCAAHGLRCTDVFGDYDRQPVSATAPRILCVAEKIHSSGEVLDARRPTYRRLGGDPLAAGSNPDHDGGRLPIDEQRVLTLLEAPLTKQQLAEALFLESGDVVYRSLGGILHTLERRGLVFLSRVYQGTVTAGAGLAATLMSKLGEAIEASLGLRCVPGTLNVRLADVPRYPPSTDLEIPGTELHHQLSDKLYRFFPVRVHRISGLAMHVNTSPYPEEIIEVVSDVHLSDALRLEAGSPIQVELI